MPFRLARTLLLLAASAACCAPTRAQQPLPPGTFTNPVLDSGADPWVIAWKGNYYYMNSTGRNLTLWKTPDLTALRTAQKRIVWTPDPGQPWSSELWAPELHRWGSHWYIYFAADAGRNESHRIYVLENAADDPIDGDWILKGKVADTTDKWAIDADVFELNGTHYLLWSGWKGDTNGEQDIFLARLSNPWTVDSPRTLISAPTYPWEKFGDLPHGEHVNVNEGPEALIHNGRVFVVFSASGCWTDHYSLGAVFASTTADLLDPSSWTKIDHPLLATDPKAGVYSPGHNGFFTAPDGHPWIIYHANDAPGQGCGPHRSPRIQPFTWDRNGTPIFGKPVPAGVPMAKPH
jgi:GH43 family beta-xylosidase